MRPGERGSITLWMLGLGLMVLALGGISLDAWRAFSVRRSLAATADAAALAGASAIDEEQYRATGALVLVPDEAERRAHRSIESQSDRASLQGADVVATSEDVVVVVRGRVEFTLLQLIEPGHFAVRVTATASPRRSSP